MCEATVYMEQAGRREKVTVREGPRCRPLHRPGGDDGRRWFNLMNLVYPDEYCY